MDKEPGQLAYETRFEGMTLGPRGVSVAWADLGPPGRAIWARVEHLIEQRAMERFERRRMDGFTGEACGVCGSYRLIRTGKRTLCQACGATRGFG